MVVTHIREKCPLLAHERKTPNQRYSWPGSQHPETFNSTRQHPPKLQPSVNNCLCIQVKREKKKSSTAMSGSVQSAFSHHQFTIQCYWGRRGSRSCRSSPRASILWIAYVRVKWFPTDCALALPCLARSLAESLIQEHHFESSRAELCETCLCGLHNKTSFVFTQTLPSPSVAMSAYCKRQGFLCNKMLINMSSRKLCSEVSIRFD